MARLNVNPTRMELKKLKARLSTAVRGHKLLKDKSDEMVRRFTVIIREDKRLREEVEQELSLTLKQFSVARSVTPAYRAETAFSMPSMAVNVECGTESIMGVEVPKVGLVKEKRSDGLPYAYVEITSEADYSVGMVSALLPKMVLLAQTEKAVRMLADEIERLNGSVAEAAANFEANRPEDLEEAKKQIAALQKLITTISRYEGELAKMRKDSESRDRQQREVRVRAAKARAEFDRIKVIYDEEYKQASVKLEALKKTVAEEAKGIDPELLEKYKAIKRHSTPPITRIHDDRCGGCNMQLPAADMNKIRTGAPYVECENCGRIILVK